MLRTLIMAAWVLAVSACGDDTAPGAAPDLSGAAPDLASCLPLGQGDSTCPHCSPGSGASCGTDQEGFQCQYGAVDAPTYCRCGSGRWGCGGQPFGTPDLALPRD